MPTINSQGQKFTGNGLHSHAEVALAMVLQDSIDQHIHTSLSQNFQRNKEVKEKQQLIRWGESEDSRVLRFRFILACSSVCTVYVVRLNRNFLCVVDFDCIHFPPASLNPAFLPFHLPPPHLPLLP